MARRIGIFLWLACLACFAAPQKNAGNAAKAPPETGCELTSNDYAVYTALLRQLGKPEHPEEAWQSKEILIIDTTGGPVDLRKEWSGWGSISKEVPSQNTLDDLASKAMSVCALRAQIGDSQTYRLIGQDEVNQFFKKGHGGWDGFYKSTPSQRASGASRVRVTTLLRMKPCST